MLQNIVVRIQLQYNNVQKICEKHVLLSLGNCFVTVVKVAYYFSHYVIFPERHCVWAIRTIVWVVTSAETLPRSMKRSGILKDLLSQLFSTSFYVIRVGYKLYTWKTYFVSRILPREKFSSSVLIYWPTQFLVWFVHQVVGEVFVFHDSWVAAPAIRFIFGLPIKWVFFLFSSW